MPRKTATAAILVAIASCATWQDSIRKGLSATATGAEQAIGTAETVCKQVLQVCIAKQENPCPALDKCLAIRQHMIQVAIVTQLTALSGYIAVDAADQKKAKEALEEAGKLLNLIKRALEALR